MDGNVVTAYADDTHMLIKGDTTQQILTSTKTCLDKHLGYLSDQGMITNLTKTEAVIFGATMEK